MQQKEMKYPGQLPISSLSDTDRDVTHTRRKWVIDRWTEQVPEEEQKLILKRIWKKKKKELD